MKIDVATILDLGKWVLGGIAGYAVHSLKDYEKRRRLRQNLYRELAANYEEIVRVLRVVEENPALIPGFPGNARLSFTYYNFAISDGKDIYFDLKDCSILESVVSDLVRITNDAANFGRSGVHEGLMFAHHVETAVHEGRLNHRLFRKVCSPTAKAWLDDHEGSKKLLSVPAAAMRR